MKLTWLCVTLLLLHLVACEKEHAEEKADRIPIDGFQLSDNMGNVTGTVGTVTDDWQFIEWKFLSALEKSFLDFADDVDMTNTRVTTVTHPFAFPNPFQQRSNIFLQSGDSVKLKLAVVDASGFVWRNMAVKMKGTRVIYFDFSNSREFPAGKSLRYYYSFSAASQPHFKVGYGDVKVCDAPGEYLSCF